VENEDLAYIEKELNIKLPEFYVFIMKNFPETLRKRPWHREILFRPKKIVELNKKFRALNNYPNFKSNFAIGTDLGEEEFYSIELLSGVEIVYRNRKNCETPKKISESYTVVELIQECLDDMKEIIKKRKLKKTDWKKEMEFKKSIRENPYGTDIIAQYYSLIELLNEYNDELTDNTFNNIILKVLSSMGHKGLVQKRLDGCLKYYIEDLGEDLTLHPSYKVEIPDFSEYE